MIRLVSFDLDGTLIPGTTTSLLLAKKLGHFNQALKLEEQLRLGLINSTKVADETALLLRGVPLNDVRGVYESAPRISNVGEVVDALHEAGATVILGSITWSFFVRMFADQYGFDDYCGTAMEIVDGRLSGVIEAYCTEIDKLKFFLETRDRLGVASEESVAVGDSKSDHPIFRSAGISVALNADQETRSIADLSIDTGDLSDVLRLLPI